MTPAVTKPEADSRDTVRQVAVLVSTLLAVVVSFLGSGAVVGTPVSQVADGALDTDATLVAPGGPAFAIWAIVYTGLVLLGLNQAMPWRRTDPRQRRSGWLIVASALLNAAWIVTVQFELLVISVVLIGALVAVLVAVLLRLNERPPTTAYERVVIDGTLGLYRAGPVLPQSPIPRPPRSMPALRRRAQRPRRGPSPCSWWPRASACSSPSGSEAGSRPPSDWPGDWLGSRPSVPTAPRGPTPLPWQRHLPPSPPSSRRSS